MLPYIVFEIPEFVFGYPLYQLGEARDYLLKTLQPSGFQVWPVNEKYLLISWVKNAGRTAGTYRPPLITELPAPRCTIQLPSEVC
jgi:hypothetical protein